MSDPTMPAADVLPEELRERYRRMRSEWIEGAMAPLIGCRLRRGYSRRDMAQLLQCSEATIRRIEMSDDITLSQYVDYALALGFAPCAMQVAALAQEDPA